MPKLITLGLTLIAAIYLTACAGGPGSSGYSASGTRVDSSSLLSAEQKVTQLNIPEPLRQDFLALYSQGRQNSVLHAMRAGLLALRLDYKDLARTTFDQAIREIEALQEGAEQAKRAKNIFVGEREKWFKGESHERAALYFYRGILYLQDQDFGNAAACFKRSQIQDITSDEETDFAGDWLSSEIGLALASYRNGQAQDAEAAIRRAKTFKNNPANIVWPTAKTNILIVVEVGHGPIKYRGGDYSEELRYAEKQPEVKLIRIKIPQPARNFSAAEDLFFQATTRGDRQVDFILRDKASFKEDTSNATTGLFAGALVASQTERSGIAAGVLGLAALGTAIASSISDPSADIRNWDNLPHSIYLIPLELVDSTSAIELEMLDGAGNVLNQTTIKDVQASTTQIKQTLTVHHVHLIPSS